jgi:hypothetical protein
MAGQVEILRSGFLSDGRFYSIEAGRLKGGDWGAWMVCVPGGVEIQKDESHALHTASHKELLARWASELSEETIGGFAEGFCP